MRKVIFLVITSLFLGSCQAVIPQGEQERAATNDNQEQESLNMVEETTFSSPADMDEPIQLAWFYKPAQIGTLDALSEEYDLFIFTQNDEEYIEQLKALDSDCIILQYFRVNDIQDIGDCNQSPYQNQVAYHPGDFCEIKANHNEWFLHDKYNQFIISNQYYLMDSGNRDWQVFFRERVEESQAWPGWDGIFLDNVEASLSKRIRVEGTPSKYANEEEYIASIEAFLHYLYANFAYTEQKPMYANIIALENPEIWFRYLKYLDGAMLEAFAVDWTDGYLDVDEWEMQLKVTELTQSLGKRIVLVAQGDQNDLDRQNFALASYLLVNQGNAYFRYSNDEYYDEIWTYANYNVDLGLPLGQRYFQDGKWQRDFENGKVWANPENHEYSIEIK